MADRLLRSVPEIVERSQKQSWLVKYVIPEGMGVIFGQSGTFKSFIALDLALHITYGMQWLGQKTIKADVVYVSAEGGGGVSKRIQAWHEARGMDWRKCSLKVVIDHITPDTDFVRLRKEIESIGGARLIILDTFSQIFEGDENSAESVSEFLRLLSRTLLKPLGSTIILIHHVGHSEDSRPRGSSAITANADFLYSVSRTKGERIAIFENTKMKDADLFLPVNFHASKIDLGADQDGDPLSSLSASYVTDPAELIAAVEAAPTGHKAMFLQIASLGLPTKEARARFYDDHGGDSESRKKAWNRCKAWATAANLVSDDGGILRCTTGHYRDITGTNGTF